MVKVYSKNNCMQCKMVKRYLTEHHVVFEEHNIDREPEYRDYLLGQGFMATPVVEAEGMESFSGFAPEKLKALAV